MKINLEYITLKIIGAELLSFNGSVDIIFLCEDLNIYMVAFSIRLGVKHSPYKKFTTIKTINELLSRFGKTAGIYPIDRNTIRSNYNTFYASKLEEAIERLDKEACQNDTN
jgi:hypothetical protein